MRNLKPVSKEDYRFLYELLKERELYQNISHQRMPTWEEHAHFNDRKPYSRDYIICNGTEKVGRVYLTRNNEVGIFVKKLYRGLGYGAFALKELLSGLPLGETVYANIAPENKESQQFFKKYGFNLLQVTYAKSVSSHRHS